MHYTGCKLDYRWDLISSAIRCGDKNIRIYWYRQKILCSIVHSRESLINTEWIQPSVYEKYCVLSTGWYWMPCTADGKNAKGSNKATYKVTWRRRQSCFSPCLYLQQCQAVCSSVAVIRFDICSHAWPYRRLTSTHTEYILCISRSSSVRVGYF